MPLEKNSEIELYIDAYSSEGSGVGRFEGMAVFVAGAAKGDKIRAHIIKAKKNYAVGKLVKILKPSKDRISSPCSVFPSCGGCVYRHIRYEAELELKSAKVADAFSRLGHLEVPLRGILGAENTAHYRNKAQYPVGMVNGNLQIGFYAQHSHRIVDSGHCLLQPEVFAEILEIFRAWITQNGIPVYDPETHTGLLRHIYLRRGEATGEIMACAVVNGDSLPHSEKLIADLQRVDGMKSIVLNRNPNRTNVILGDKCEALWGTPYIEDVLCGVTVRLSPLSFYQVNRAQAQRLYEKAAEYACLTGEETLLDLYCGTGTIGLSMANRVKRLIGAEIVPEAVRDAKINAERNGILNAEFLCADAPEAAEALKNRGIKPDVVILDPPRKGCAPALIDTVCAMRPDRVVYVSCDPATLARDCALFDEKGYRVAEATPVDLFPGTAHVETVALLQKEHC